MADFWDLDGALKALEPFQNMKIREYKELEWHERFELQIRAMSLLYGVDFKGFMKYLYYALTGKESGLPMFGPGGIADLLGEEETQHRMNMFDVWRAGFPVNISTVQPTEDEIARALPQLQPRMNTLKDVDKIAFLWVRIDEDDAL